MDSVGLRASIFGTRAQTMREQDRIVLRLGLEEALRRYHLVGGLLVRTDRINVIATLEGLRWRLQLRGLATWKKLQHELWLSLRLAGPVFHVAVRRGENLEFKRYQICAWAEGSSILIEDPQQILSAPEERLTFLDSYQSDVSDEKQRSAWLENVVQSEHGHNAHYAWKYMAVVNGRAARMGSAFEQLVVDTIRERAGPGWISGPRTVHLIVNGRDYWYAMNRDRYDVIHVNRLLWPEDPRLQINIEQQL